MRLLVLILAFAWCSSADAMHFKRMTTEDGLPENTGQAIIQDKQGFIWIGTQNGLTRFDGQRHMVFQHERGNSNSLSNNQVEGLLEDKEGNIWVATRHGLNRINPTRDSIQRYFCSDKSVYAYNHIFAQLTQDHAGKIWFTNGSHLYYIGKDDSVTKAHELNQKGEYSGVFAHGNQLYVYNGTLLYVKRENTIDAPIEFKSKISCVADVSGEIILGTHNGCLRIDGSTWHNNAAPKSLVLYIKRDSRKNLWIGSTSGLYQVTQQGEYIKHVHDPKQTSSISYDVNLSMLEDREGVLWFGTGQGVNLHSWVSEQFIRVPDGNPNLLANQNITCLNYNRTNNTLHAGTLGGIYSLTADNWGDLSGYQSAPMLKGKVVEYIFTDNTGNTFVFTDNQELYCSQTGRDDFRLLMTPIPVLRVRGMIQDQSNGYWIAGSNGLFRYTDDVIFKPEWLSDLSYSVRLIKLDKRFLVSHRDFSLVVDPINQEIDTIISNTEDDKSLSHNMVTDIRLLNNTYWISTFGGGICVADTHLKRFKRIDKKSDLRSDAIWCLYPDDPGEFLWGMTDYGIVRVNTRDSSIQTFTTSHGINFNDFTMLAHCGVGDFLAFGNPNGVTVFNPNRVNVPNLKSGLVLSSVQVNYQPIQWDVNSNNVCELTLNPEDKTLFVDVAWTSYIDFENQRFDFKIEGYDDTWRRLSISDPQIRLVGMPPGNYTIKVRAQDGLGRVLPSENLIELRVIPPFTSTPLFTGLLVLLSIIFTSLIIWYVSYQRRRKVMRALEKEKAVVTERERIARDLHDHLGANLTKIVSDFDLLELTHNEQLNPSVREELDLMRSFTHETIEELRETIWTIDSDSISIDDLVTKVRSYLDRVLGKSVTWKVDFEDSNIQPRLLGPSQALHLQRIVQEATQNMMKHSNATEYTVTLVQGIDVLTVLISDNGDGSKQSTGTGNGLTNIKSRIHEIGGTCTIVNVQGYTIKLSIPFKLNA